MTSGQDISSAVFAAALKQGDAEPPTTLRRALEELAVVPNVRDFDEEAFEKDIVAELPFLREVFNSVPPTAEQTARWESSVRWVLLQLQAWQPDSSYAASRLRLLLTSVRVLDVRATGLESVAANLTARALPSGLRRLLESADIRLMGQRNGPVANFSADLDGAVAAGNFRLVEQMLRRVMLHLHSDMHAATILLWKLSPHDLAASLVAQDSVMKLHAVCEVLGDSAPAFAHQVASPTFKFLSIRNIEDAYRAGRATYSWAQALEDLLLDVAPTEYWRSFMASLFNYPQAGVLPLQGLARALSALQESHWADYVQSISLHYSKAAAQPVADVLAQFEGFIGATAATGMWRVAHQCWTKWDYGSGEPDTFMSSPLACALDYPVAKYFATVPAAERFAEEARLLTAIDELEMTWFAQVTQLITQRNRLLSQLRLVRHGSTLSGGGTNLLPPPVQPVDDYSTVRYGYHDVQSLRLPTRT